MSPFDYQTNYFLVKKIDQPAITCPSCDREGMLQILFFQVGQEGIFIRRLDKLIARTFCKGCKVTLPEKFWDASIRLAGQREKDKIKLITSIRISKRGKYFFWLLTAGFMIATAVLLSYGLGFWDKDTATEQVTRDQNALFIANPRKGDLCQVIISEAQDEAYAKYTLFKIISVDEERNKITVAPHKEQLFALNWNGLSSAADHFDTGNPETFILKAFRQMRFQKLKENPELITRNIYNIIRP